MEMKYVLHQTENKIKTKSSKTKQVIDLVHGKEHKCAFTINSSYKQPLLLTLCFSI